MATKFGSFDASPMHAFLESKAHARNPVKKESVTPIIIITPTVRPVRQDRWVYDGGWNHTQSLVGSDLYEDNPDLWRSDLQQIIEELANIENADWSYGERIKPNVVIWLWQPVHARLSRVSKGYVNTLIPWEDPPFPYFGTAVSRIGITETHLLTAAGEPMPAFVESVRQVQINTETLMLRGTTDGRPTSPISAMFSPPTTIGIAMRMPDIGETTVHGLTYYWLPQPSLGQMFFEAMEDRPLDCVQENPTPTTRNRRVIVRVMQVPGLARFTDPLIESAPRRTGEMSPKDAFVAMVEQYRSAKDPTDPCGGGKVEVDWQTMTGVDWLFNLKSILKTFVPQ